MIDSRAKSKSLQHFVGEEEFLTICTQTWVTVHVFWDVKAKKGPKKASLPWICYPKTTCWIVCWKLCFRQISSISFTAGFPSWRVFDTRYCRHSNTDSCVYAQGLFQDIFCMYPCRHAPGLEDGFQFGRFVAFSASTVVLRIPWYE
jgi:hypothetical protein